MMNTSLTGDELANDCSGYLTAQPLISLEGSHPGQAVTVITWPIFET